MSNQPKHSSPAPASSSFIDKLSKLFGGLDMSWKHVIIFAVGIGVFVGLINQVPVLEETSFRDIAVSFEWWVLFAFLIVTNCKSGLEAAAKCFVFFLISQPLIYLVEIPTLGFALGMSYWTTTWLPATFLTLPGGFIAYYAKKQNALGAVILGLAGAILAIVSMHYLSVMFSPISFAPFPRHLLTVLFCFAAIALMNIGIQKKGNMRALSLAITIVATVAFDGYCILNGLNI